GTCHRLIEPPFPATCPFVTSIGAATFDADQTAETGAPYSAGGFSDFFAHPEYQDAAIKEYLN
ncbi:hypothetical protein DFH06DRAFT_940570, partial [Mycena polygramma]